MYYDARSLLILQSLHFVGVDHQPVEQPCEAASMCTRTIANDVHVLDDIVVWRVDLLCDLSVHSVMGHIASSTGVRPMDYVHWDATPLDAQIPHTAIVLSEFDDCDERPHLLSTNIRMEFAAVLSYIIVCREFQHRGVWSARPRSRSDSMAGTKAERASMDVYRTQGLPARRPCQALISASSDKQQSFQFGLPGAQLLAGMSDWMRGRVDLQEINDVPDFHI
ncbi:hypothetical protein BU17DRAFT_65245 [Hysterangium stoloniferum]|nr:hypothetical protein BU17DRAFT_65245 [Hysterangium stoloniferum]